MKKGILAVLLCAVFALGQASKRIQPDGITKRTEDHRFDMSACDVVKIEGPARTLDVSGGEFHAYWFKKYADITRLTITCTIESK